MSTSRRSAQFRAGRKYHITYNFSISHCQQRGVGDAAPYTVGEARYSLFTIH